MFTYQYKQPDDYHFSLDSIHLAEFVAEYLKSHDNLSALRILDLCAGCGVIGLELSFYLRELRHFDFVEVQDIYTSFFQHNVKVVNRSELQLRWHVLNYESLLENSWNKKADVIVSNPPYFHPHQGMLSPSEFKNRCRFFLDSTFEKFILAIMNVLANNGRAFFLLRSLQQHGYDAFEEIKKIISESQISVQKITSIRGTDVVMMKKG
jgi:tRNA1(Val) A37 N6-methylase TrmN6